MYFDCGERAVRAIKIEVVCCLESYLWNAPSLEDTFLDARINQEGLQMNDKKLMSRMAVSRWTSLSNCFPTI